MTTIQIRGQMPELPKSPPPILTLPTPRVNESMLLGRARSLRLKATEKAGSIARNDSVFTYSEGAYDLILHRASGAFRFKDKRRWQVDRRAHVQFSDEEAVRLARVELRRYKLLPERSQVLRVSRLNVATAGPDRQIRDHRVIDVAVCLQPLVNGVPVDGRGGTVTVYLDHEGKLTCVDHIIRRIGPVYRKVTELHSPEDAVEEARRAWDRRGIGEVEIDEVRFCYFELGWDDPQRYLQPAYYILAKLIGPDRRIRTGDIFVMPAAVKNAGRIVPLPPRPTRQRPRQ